MHLLPYVVRDLQVALIVDKVLPVSRSQSLALRTDNTVLASNQTPSWAK